MSDKRKYLNGLITGLFIAAVIVAATYVGSEAVNVWKQNKTAVSDETQEEAVTALTMQKLQLIEQIIEENYALEMVDGQTLENGIYRGLVWALEDPYSEYYSAEEMQEQQKKIEGVYYGIGAYIGFDTAKNMCYISKLIKNSAKCQN